MFSRGSFSKYVKYLKVIYFTAYTGNKVAAA